jgi:hypothetical protein
MPKREDNVKFVKRLMEYGPYGALQQIFILQAIEKYAEVCAKADPKSIDGLFNGEAWVGTAKFLKSELDKHYGSI